MTMSSLENASNLTRLPTRMSVMTGAGRNLRHAVLICVIAFGTVGLGLLVPGLLLGASNMGFKVNRLLVGGNSIKQWVSIPYRSPYHNADDILQRLMAGSGTVTRYLPTFPASTEFWTGSLGTNFAVMPGEGYELAPTITIERLIVGSHDASVVVPAGGFIANREYIMSIPYHSVSETADDLLRELPTGGTLTKLLPTSPPSVSFWTGSLGTNFPLVIGEAYKFKPIANAPGFIPSHY